MLQFIGGPAEKLADGLMLRSAPKLLRVVYDATYTAAVCKKDRTEWDALDQPDDKPRKGEVLYAYRLLEYRGMIHLRMSPRRHSGYYANATYEFVEPQPDDATMRDNANWRLWVAGQTSIEGGVT